MEKEVPRVAFSTASILLRRETKALPKGTMSHLVYFLLQDCVAVGSPALQGNTVNIS